MRLNYLISALQGKPHLMHVWPELHPSMNDLPRFLYIYYILKGTDISQVDFVLIRWFIPQWKYRQVYVPWSKHGIFSFGHQSHNRIPYDRYIIFYKLIAGHTQLYEQFAVPQFWPWHEWMVFMVYKSFTLWLFNTTINILWKPWPIYRYIIILIYDDWNFPLNCQKNMMDFPLRKGKKKPIWVILGPAHPTSPGSL